MQMGQTKVPHKVGIQATIIRATDTDSYLQNQRFKNKEVGLKTRKMMKSRSIKLSKLETSLKSSPERHGQPAWQPSFRKASPSESSCWPCTSPNYMKSTRSSDAKKEQTKVSISGLMKLQTVAKTLSRISSMKRVRTLTRRNKYVRSPTCSSIQKELRFPTELRLDPGATEADGGSVVKVCSYNHCSLNRHDYTPLRCFFASKRKLLKTQKVMPFTPVQDQVAFKRSCKESDYLEEGNSVTVAVDESFGETLNMESKDGKISAPWPDNKRKVLAQSENGDGYLKVFLRDKSRPYYHQEIMEWQHFGDVDSVSECESMMPGEQQFEEPIVLEEQNRTSSALENEIAEEYSSFVADATIWDTDPKVKSTDEQGRVQLKEPNIVEEENKVVRGASSLVDDSILCNTCKEIKSIYEQSSCLSDPMDEITEVRVEDVHFSKYPTKADGDKGNKGCYTNGEIGGKVNADIIEESKSTDNTIKATLRKINDTEFSPIKETLKAVDSSQAEFEQREAGNSAEQKEIKPNIFLLEISRASKDQHGMNAVKLNPNKNSFEEVQAPEVNDISSTAELDVFPVIRKQTALTKHSCNKFKRSTRCKKADEESTKAREFNTRGPNFLPHEPDPEVERVVLRHQETDERKSAEEWMLDYALQKAVNRLASARTRNVALLVEAFETVLPK